LKLDTSAGAVGPSGEVYVAGIANHRMLRIVWRSESYIRATFRRVHVSKYTKERPRMALSWEKLDVYKKGKYVGVALFLFRAKVPGGWLLKAPGGGMIFFEDPQHAWEISPALKWEKLEGRKVRGFRFFGYRWHLFRTPVPGGWLVMSPPGGSFGGPEIAFYPDPDHKWDGSSLP